jgi:hypothetical protein
MITNNNYLASKLEPPDWQWVLFWPTLVATGSTSQPEANPDNLDLRKIETSFYSKKKLKINLRFSLFWWAVLLSAARCRDPSCQWFHRCLKRLRPESQRSKLQLTWCVASGFNIFICLTFETNRQFFQIWNPKRK